MMDFTRASAALVFVYNSTLREDAKRAAYLRCCFEATHSHRQRIEEAVAVPRNLTAIF